MIEGSEIKVLKNNVLISEIEGGQQTINGVIILDDDMKDRGIKPRWCKVYATGPETFDIAKDDWILVDHGRWSRGFKAKFGDFESEFRWVDYNDILIVQSEKPSGINTL